jgi:hypothetical protein
VDQLAPGRLQLATSVVGWWQVGCLLCKYHFLLVPTMAQPSGEAPLLDMFHSRHELMASAAMHLSFYRYLIMAASTRQNSASLFAMLHWHVEA